MQEDQLCGSTQNSLVILTILRSSCRNWHGIRSTVNCHCSNHARVVIVRMKKADGLLCFSCCHLECPPGILLCDVDDVLSNNSILVLKWWAPPAEKKAGCTNVGDD